MINNKQIIKSVAVRDLDIIHNLYHSKLVEKILPEKWTTLETALFGARPWKKEGNKVRWVWGFLFQSHTSSPSFLS